MESIIYGLEFNSRSLTTQQDADEIRFFIGTHIINGKNQIHELELTDENKTKSRIFSHDLGEIWKLSSSANDSLLASVYTANQTDRKKTAILRISQSTELLDLHEFADIEVLDTDQIGSEIKTTEFHPTNSSLIATVLDGKILLFNRAESKSQIVHEIMGRNLNGGMWSNANQFTTFYENNVKSFDIRDAKVAWQIDEAHSQPVRDLDANPNKAFHLATAGDDCLLKIWDVRGNVKEPVFSRSDHMHWIFSVSFNKFHDQLLLTCSSDGKVLLTCASSCSSEAPKELSDGKKTISDGLLETFTNHEESVYACEWSSCEPWVWASVSFDGRVIISRIPKKYKYQILL